MKKIVIITSIILLVVLNSCTTKSSKSDDMIKSGTYILTDNNEVFKNYQGNDITFIMDNEEHYIKGNSSCNQYFINEFETNPEGYIRFGPVVATKKYCPDMNIERTYFDLLSNANSYKVENDYLYLYNDKLLLLTFKLSQ